MPDAAATSRLLLAGAIDLHMHTAPDIYPRSVTTFEAAKQAEQAGMAAIVVKSHSTDTASRAELVRNLTGFPVWGGVALNYPVGGLNPYAVSETVRQGGRVVWMPTTSARNFLRQAENVPTLREQAPLSSEGLVVSQAGRLVPEAAAILDLVADHDLILASGHLAPDETVLLFEEAVRRQARRLVVTHPHAAFIDMSVETMRHLSSIGALHEMHYSFVTDAVSPPQNLGDIARLIRAVGVESCYLATDGGQSVNPPPVEMLRLFIEGLIELGFSEPELVHMTHEVPARLLSRDPMQ
jgi:Family of unknown function (DUF6282)